MRPALEEKTLRLLQSPIGWFKRFTVIKRITYWDCTLELSQLSSFSRAFIIVDDYQRQNKWVQIWRWFWNTDNIRTYLETVGLVKALLIQNLDLSVNDHESKPQEAKQECTKENLKNTLLKFSNYFDRFKALNTIHWETFLPHLFKDFFSASSKNFSQNMSMDAKKFIDTNSNNGFNDIRETTVNYEDQKDNLIEIAYALGMNTQITQNINVAILQERLYALQNLVIKDDFIYAKNPIHDYWIFKTWRNNRYYEKLKEINTKAKKHLETIATKLNQISNNTAHTVKQNNKTFYEDVIPLLDLNLPSSAYDQNVIAKSNSQHSEHAPLPAKDEAKSKDKIIYQPNIQSDHKVPEILSGQLSIFKPVQNNEELRKIIPFDRKENSDHHLRALTDPNRTLGIVTFDFKKESLEDFQFSLDEDLNDIILINTVLSDFNESPLLAEKIFNVIKDWILQKINLSNIDIKTIRSDENIVSGQLSINKKMLLDLILLICNTASQNSSYSIEYLLEKMAPGYAKILFRDTYQYFDEEINKLQHQRKLFYKKYVQELEATKKQMEINFVEQTQTIKQLQGSNQNLEAKNQQLEVTTEQLQKKNLALEAAQLKQQEELDQLRRMMEILLKQQQSEQQSTSRSSSSGINSSGSEQNNGNQSANQNTQNNSSGSGGGVSLFSTPGQRT